MERIDFAGSVAGPHVCMHDFLDDSHTCTTCGLMMDFQEFDDVEFSKSHLRVRTPHQSEFEKDLLAHRFDEDVTKWIMENSCLRMPYKAETRAKILFAYAYLAHLHLKKTFDPHELALKMSLDRFGIDEAIKIASGISAHQVHNQQTSRLSASVVVMTPESCVSDICKALDLSEEHKSNLKAIAVAIVKKNPLLLEEDPKRLAAGILRYYYDKAGVTFNLISKKLGYTTAITRKYSKMVAECLG